MRVSGVVQDVKTFDSQFGPMYSIYMSDGKKYGTGSKQPRVKPGDIVEFDTIQKGSFVNVSGSIEVTGKAASNGSGTGTQAAQAPAAVGGAATQTKSTYLPEADKQAIISRQAAVNSATAFMAMALEAGVLTVPKTGKTEEKLGGLLAIHSKIAGQFNDYALGKVSSPSEEPAESGVEADPEDNW